MKKLLSIGLVLGLVAQASAITVTNYITDGFGTPIRTRVIITPFTITTIVGGTNVLGLSVGVDCPAGAWSVGLLGGFYFVDQGLGQPVVVGWATPEDTNTYTLAQIVAAAQNPIPSFFFSGEGPNTMTFLTNYFFTNYVAFIAYSTNILVNELQQEFPTNRWVGATNVIDVSLGRQAFSSLNACSITGIVGKSVTAARTTTLLLQNPVASGSNWNLTLAPTILTKDGIRFLTVTNGQIILLSVGFDPSFGGTTNFAQINQL